MAVVVFCHSKQIIMGRFLSRAMERNMTNGDFAFFTVFPLQGFYTARPWFFFVNDKRDIPRLLRAFHVVKQVCTCRSLFTARSCDRMSSVCPSVGAFVCNVGGSGPHRLEILETNPTPSLFVAQRPPAYSQGNMGKFWGD